MSQIVHLNRERWLALANGAMNAVAEPSAARKLGEAAGRMVTATPPATEKYAMALCTAFRWSCQAYGFATESQRKILGRSLWDQADAVRRLFAHTPPAAGAVALPVPEAEAQPPRPDLPDHPWMRRADIGGA